MEKKLLLVIVVSLLLVNCANRGIGPQGGAVDSIPPVLIKSTAPDGTLNFTDNSITLYFDEYIQLLNPSENVLISPPQQRPPEIKAIGKRIQINFEEEMSDSTTYTIDFGSSIVDNNERNPLKNFSTSFSTSNNINSLEIYGQIINAEDLNYISGITIGIHNNLNDSAFEKLPFQRISRSDTYGEFAIRNIKPGTYRLYGLKDVSRDYVYQPGEGIAIYDSLITPYIHTTFETDTLWRDSIINDTTTIPIIDTLITSQYIYYEPSTILLKFFSENKKKNYFQRLKREHAHSFTLLFSAPQPQIPTVRPLFIDSLISTPDSVWRPFTEHSICQVNPTKDTITYWLKDSIEIKQDTLCFEMTYFKSDSLYNLVPQTDTLLAVYRAPRMSEKAKEAQARQRLADGLQLTVKNTLEIYDTLTINSQTPIASIIEDSIHLQMKVDTTWQTIPATFQYRDNTHLQLQMLCKLEPGNSYRLSLDSAAVTDIYQLSSMPDTYTFKVRSLEEYATLRVQLSPYHPRAMIQLLNEQDKPIKTLQAQEEGTVFQYLSPQSYYLRMFIDENRDGKWTTGDWLKHRQPEEVFYFSKRLTLRANWEFEETFDWVNIPLLEQKPTALRKDANCKK